MSEARIELGEDPTNETELEVVPTPPEIDFNFASHANNALASQLDTIIGDQAIHDLKHALENSLGTENAAQIILYFAANIAGLLRPSPNVIALDDREREAGELHEVYYTSFQRQVNQAQIAYEHDGYLEPDGSINLSQIEELYRETEEYDDQSLLQIIGYAEKHITTSPPEYFKYALRLDRILILKSMTESDQ